MRIYIPVVWKLLLALIIAFSWLGFSVWMGWVWIEELSAVVTPIGAWVIILGVALLPGMASAFVLASLVLDRRPDYEVPEFLPPVSILIAAYNEERAIADSLTSIITLQYSGPIETIVINDGSTDRTAEIVEDFINHRDRPKNHSIRLVNAEQNAGKSNALNLGLAQASHDLIVTVDGDSYLRPNSLTNIVVNLISGPSRNVAVAGTVLVRNSRSNLLSKIQEWDYFLGISVVKRTQSLYQGTLVAQGAFSIYRRHALEAVGGWPDTVGEDIVLTWGLAKNGWGVGYAENAFVFTNVPETLSAYYKQRRRWARGLIEAFKKYPEVIYDLRLNTPFIYFNLLFPYIDFSYLFFFLPGVIAAIFFQWYALVGLLTLLLLPLAALCNIIMFKRQQAVFRRYGLNVRRNISGIIFYSLCYQLLLAPASLAGYLSEFFGRKKVW